MANRQDVEGDNASTSEPDRGYQPPHAFPGLQEYNTENSDHPFGRESIVSGGRTQRNSTLVAEPLMPQTDSSQHTDIDIRKILQDYNIPLARLIAAKAT